MLLATGLTMPGPLRAAEAVNTNVPARPQKPAKALEDFGIRQTGEINRQVQESWQANSVSPSPAATDAEWCRRVYLDLVGRIPTVDELKSYVSNRAPDKRKQLVDQLLGDEYLEEYARHWTTKWTNLLIGRTGGVDNNSLADRRGMQQYLRRAFQKNKSFDQFMVELVTAQGSCRPGDENFNGAANFSGGQDGRKWRAGVGQNSGAVSGHGRTVHAVPQPPL
jgi:hypothetical protein